MLSLYNFTCIYTYIILYVYSLKAYYLMLDNQRRMLLPKEDHLSVIINNTVNILKHICKLTPPHDSQSKSEMLEHCSAHPTSKHIWLTMGKKNQELQ